MRPRPSTETTDDVATSAPISRNRSRSRRPVLLVIHQGTCPGSVPSRSTVVMTPQITMTFALMTAIPGAGSVGLRGSPRPSPASGGLLRSLIPHPTLGQVPATYRPTPLGASGPRPESWSTSQSIQQAPVTRRRAVRRRGERSIRTSLRSEPRRTPAPRRRRWCLPSSEWSSWLAGIHEHPAANAVVFGRAIVRPFAFANETEGSPPE